MGRATSWSGTTGSPGSPRTARSDEQLADPVTFTAMLDYPLETSVELSITD